MRKLVLAVLFIAINLSALAKWNKYELADKFGDGTGVYSLYTQADSGNCLSIRKYEGKTFIVFEFVTGVDSWQEDDYRVSELTIKNLDTNKTATYRVLKADEIMYVVFNSEALYEMLKSCKALKVGFSLSDDFTVDTYNTEDLSAMESTLNKDYTIKK